MSSDGIVGEILDGKYSIERQLGKGGMGTVYLSTHIGTGRPVAVKVIAPEFMKRSEFVERFRREAKAAGRLRHPNVVDVTDFGFSRLENGENAAYLVMEYLDGCTLGEVLDEEKQLPVEFTVNILEQVCSAVEEAHKQGIIHRDLKPDNIWLEPNLRGGYTVKVLDFGIAKLEETQLEETADSIEIPYEGGSETKFIKDKVTLADSNQSETLADKKNSTVIAENETMALVEESKTKVSESNESKTVIQPIEPKPSKVVDLKDGTAILPANQTQAIESEDSKDTRIITDENEDTKSTKVISAQEDTDKPSLKSASTTNLTRVGAVLGTPLYMSPEQCRGQKLTQHSDIYSLAVIAYQMLSGKLPFTGDYVKVMDGHKNEVPPELKAKKVPKKLKGIVMKSLSKDTADRPDTAEAFASKMRANSEGLGVLLRRSIVIYSERLPKLLTIAVLTFLPLVFITLLRVGLNFYFGINEYDHSFIQIVSGVLAVLSFFLQVVTAALLVGMVTWVVAQTLAYPLRSVSVRAAFREVRKRWKMLAGTVTLSTLLSLLSFAVGIILFSSGLAMQLAFLYFFVAKELATVLLIVVSVVGFVFIGVLVSSSFMLIAPSIMMEDVGGIAAFKRSISLVKRSFQTVFATSLLVYVVPIVVSIAIAFSVGSIISNIQKTTQIKQMKKEGVVAEIEEPKKENGDLNIAFNREGLKVIDKKPDDKKKDDEKKDMKRQFGQALTEGIFELIWTPLAILISSFTSVITALIYFKTRQAGGESMQELLGKLDDADEPQSIWQQRVRERLRQSGKITGNTTNSSKP